MNKKLKINPAFKNLIAPLSGEEFAQLEQNILAHGRCRDSIKVWQNYIIDGHNRYAICQKHGLPYDVQKIRLANKDAAKLWIAENQLGRRNLTSAVRIELACLKAKVLHAAARENNQPFSQREVISQIAGVSGNTVHKYMRIAGEGSAELIRQVRNGELKIGTAYKNMQMATRTVETMYDDTDPQYYGTEMCYINVLGRTEGIWLFYAALGDAGNAEGLDRVVRGLEVHHQSLFLTIGFV